MSASEQSPVRQGPPPVSRLVVSTDALPERDRVPFFREELSRVLNVDITPLSEGLPRHAMNYVAAGPIGVSLLEGSPSRYLRTRRHLSDSDENFTLGIFTRGRETISQNGQAIRVATGDGFFMANALPQEAVIPEGAHVTALSIDGASLRALVRHPERAAGDHLAAARPGVALLKGYLQAFAATSDTLTPDLVQSFGGHVLDLVASIIGANRDGAAAVEAGGVKAARLRAVLSAIAARAGDPSFSVEVMAAELAITARYIQSVLEDTGATFSERLLEERLRRAWRLLTDSRSSHLKVATVAFDCGFRDLSTFNRAFRRRFGETPTAVRGAARGENVPDPRGPARRWSLPSPGTDRGAPPASRAWHDHGHPFDASEKLGGGPMDANLHRRRDRSCRWCNGSSSRRRRSPERDRLPFYRDTLGRMLNVDISPLCDGPPRHVMDYVAAGPIAFSPQEGTACRCSRTRRHLSEGDDNFTLGLFTRGWQTISQNGRTVRVDTGEGFFVANGLPLEVVVPEAAAVHVLRIDGGALRTLVREPEQAAGGHIAATRPEVALLKGYLQAFTTAGDGLTAELLRTFGLHVLDLVAAILGATRDGAATADAGGVRAARVRAVLSAIAARAADPGFGVETMAAELSVTPRYIQRVLEETGTTFSEHLLEQRLGRAWRMLTDPRSLSAKVATIAFDCGFRELSTFNRAFRRRFGETPTAVRGAAIGGVPGAEGARSPLAASLTAH